MSICKDCLHNEVCKYGENRSNGMYCTGEKCKQYKPTADVVEVRHGEWVGIEYDGYADGCPVYDKWECSECHEEYNSDGEPPMFNYCPECGAKMDVERSKNGK